MTATSNRPVPVRVTPSSTRVNRAKLSTGHSIFFHGSMSENLLSQALNHQFALPHPVAPILLESVARADTDVVGQYRFAGDLQDVVGFRLVHRGAGSTEFRSSPREYRK